MRIEVIKVFDIIVIRLHGAFTEEVDLHKGIEDVHSEGSPMVLLNFEDVDYINSSCFRSLAKMHHKLAAISGDVRLCSLRRNVRQLFSFAKLDTGFHIYAGEDEGVISFYNKLTSIDVFTTEWAYSS